MANEMRRYWNMVSEISVVYKSVTTPPTFAFAGKTFSVFSFARCLAHSAFPVHAIDPPAFCGGGESITHAHALSTEGDTTGDYFGFSIQLSDRKHLFVLGDFDRFVSTIVNAGLSEEDGTMRPSALDLFAV